MSIWYGFAEDDQKQEDPCARQNEAPVLPRENYSSQEIWLRAQQSVSFKITKLLLPQSVLFSDLLRNIFTVSDSRIHQES